MMKNSHSLDILFNPKAIVAVGASSNPAKIGGRIFRYTKDNGYAGKLYPINAKHRQVQGVPTFPSISDLPTGLDLAYIMAPAPAVVETMEKLAEREVKAAIIFSSGGIAILMADTATGFGLEASELSQDAQARLKQLIPFSAFAAANADRLASLDLNPFLVRPRGKGAVALDALIVPCQMRPDSGNASHPQPDNPDLDFAPGLMVKSAS